MVAKSLDEIVLDANVRERIRPYFERALAAGELDFEHDWQWNVYCDLLRAVDEHEERLTSEKDKANIVVSRLAALPSSEITKIAFSTGWPVRLKPVEVDVESVMGGLVQKVPALTRRIRKYTPLVYEIYMHGFEYASKTGQLHCFEIDLDGTKIDLINKMEQWVDVVNSGNVRFLHLLGDYLPPLLHQPLNVTVALSRVNINSEEAELLEKQIHTLSFNQILSLILLLARSEYTSIRIPLPCSGLKQAMECIDLKIPNYTVITRIAEGSGRIVYLAEDQTDRCYVAIKIAKPEGTTDSSNRSAQQERYGNLRLAEKEGRVARHLTHSNLVRYFGRGVLSDKRPYVVEEYIEGRTLRQYIKIHTSEPTKLPYIFFGDLLLKEVQSILLQVAEGLAYMHREGYVHRDIKPENIIVPLLSSSRSPSFFERESTSETPFPKVKITDLELVVKESTAPSQSYGSRIYQAPEVLLGGRVSRASDVFSLGIVMYELFTGRHPFRTGRNDDKAGIVRNICNPAFYARLKGKIQNSADVPPYYKPIITQCLEYDPSERYTSAEDIVHAIYRLEQRRQRYRRYRTRR